MNLLALTQNLVHLGVGTPGVATGGTLFTTVDTTYRTESGNDYWNGALIVFLSGSNKGLAREVTDFVALTDTLTHTPALPNAVASGDTYVILPRSQGRGVEYDNQVKILEYLQSQIKAHPPELAAVTVTGGADLATKGVYAEVVAALAITTKYRPVALVIDSVSAIDDLEIDIATGAAAAEVVVSTHRISPTAIGDCRRIPIPSIADIAANTRLAVRASSAAGATTLDVSIEYIDNLT